MDSTPASEIIRWVSMPPILRSVSSIRTPYSAPEAPVMATTSRFTKTLGLQQRFQFAGFEHLIQNVGTANELALDVKLWNGRPV